MTRYLYSQSHSSTNLHNSVEEAGVAEVGYSFNRSQGSVNDGTLSSGRVNIVGGFISQLYDLGWCWSTPKKTQNEFFISENNSIISPFNQNCGLSKDSWFDFLRFHFMRLEQSSKLRRWQVCTSFRGLWMNTLEKPSRKPLAFKPHRGAGSGVLGRQLEGALGHLWKQMTAVEVSAG